MANSAPPALFSTMVGPGFKSTSKRDAIAEEKLEGFNRKLSLKRESLSREMSMTSSKIQLNVLVIPVARLIEY